MHVKLVATTNPLVKTSDGSRFLTPEEFIVYCARVSNPSNQLNIETAPKLLRYCIKNKHWSIFEMVDLTFEIQTSRAIAAQILRHKSASFQEFSQRFSKVADFESIELRLQGKTNRQVGDEPFFCDELEVKIEDHLNYSKILYNELLQENVAKECARMILPLVTQTTLYMKNSVRNWIHYIELRSSEHTQKEHRDIANAIRMIFMNQFPDISAALDWNDENRS